MSWEPARPGGIWGRVAVAGFVVLMTWAAFLVYRVSPVPVGGDRTAEEMDAREAVLRYQFLHNASGQQTAAKVFCVTVDGLDPDDAFLRRFAAHPVPVRKASDCTSGGHGVTDKATGAKGLMLSAGRLEWISGDEATVNGGYYEANLSASANVFRLKKTSQGWTVVEDREVLIS